MIKLEQANRIIEAIFARGRELACRPMSVIVVEPGAKVKAFQKEDDSAMMRFEMAYGKAYAALALGRSSSDSSPAGVLSTGSACSAASQGPSHVLLAMGLRPEDAHASVRFSLDATNTDDDVDHIGRVTPPIVERLRALAGPAMEKSA